MKRPNVEAIRERAKAATMGPWHWTGNELLNNNSDQVVFDEFSLCEPGNKSFLAASRQDIHDLLAYIEELEQKERRL
jgi:hypothetical protein